jgi:hypothetical protein
MCVVRYNILVQEILYITVIVFLDIIHNPAILFTICNISETEFGLRLQVEPTHLGPVDRFSPYPSTSAPCQSQSRITTDSQLASPSRCQAPILDLRPIFLSP